jgi:hypothetical protein
MFSFFKCEKNVHKLPLLFSQHLHLRPHILSPKIQKKKTNAFIKKEFFSLQGSSKLIIMHWRPHVLSPKNTNNKPMLLLKKSFFPCKVQVC